MKTIWNQRNNKTTQRSVIGRTRLYESRGKGSSPFVAILIWAYSIKEIIFGFDPKDDSSSLSAPFTARLVRAIFIIFFFIKFATSNQRIERILNQISGHEMITFQEALDANSHHLNPYVLLDNKIWAKSWAKLHKIRVPENIYYSKDNYEVSFLKLPDYGSAVLKPMGGNSSEHVYVIRWMDNNLDEIVKNIKEYNRGIIREEYISTSKYVYTPTIKIFVANKEIVGIKKTRIKNSRRWEKPRHLMKIGTIFRVTKETKKTRTLFCSLNRIDWTYF